MKIKKERKANLKKFISARKKFYCSYMQCGKRGTTTSTQKQPLKDEEKFVMVLEKWRENILWKIFMHAGYSA
jgi:hypothetical protein